MNYIKRLEMEKAELEAKLAEANQAVVDLRSYLFSDKFNVDPTVQVQDVLNRLNYVSRPLFR